LELVSVIIPCYNQGIYIDDCLESVINQTYPNLEIIIVNDGSNDQFTINKLVSIEQDYPNVKIINIVNSGVSFARNFGIIKSKGKYILPLDGDDKIHTKYIEECVNILSLNNQVGVVYAYSKCFGHKKGIFVLENYRDDILLKRNVVFNAALFRKADFIKVGGYNVNMKFGYEDWDLWLSFAEHGFKFKRINRIRFYYRIKATSRNVDNANYIKRNNMIETLYNNHKYFYNIHGLSLKDILENNKISKFKYAIIKTKMLITIFLSSFGLMEVSD